MADFSLDTFELAKELQWEIEVIEDPIEAAIRAKKALVELNHIRDQRIQEGSHVVVRATGGYAFRQWDDDQQRHVTLRYDPFTGEGSSEGIGFVQNISPALPLQTLFLAVKNAFIFEKDSETAITAVNEHAIQQLAIPILEVATVELAA